MKQKPILVFRWKVLVYRYKRIRAIYMVVYTPYEIYSQASILCSLLSGTQKKIQFQTDFRLCSLRNLSGKVPFNVWRRRRPNKSDNSARTKANKTHSHDTDRFKPIHERISKWLAKCSLTQIIHVQIRFYISRSQCSSVAWYIISSGPWQSKRYCLYTDHRPTWLKFWMKKIKNDFDIQLWAGAVECKLNCLAAVCVCECVCVRVLHLISDTNSVFALLLRHGA